MFGLFGARKDKRKVEPVVDWNSKTRVLTLIDQSGRKTVRKNPSSMFAGTYVVGGMEILGNKVRFDLIPKAKHDKPRQVTFDLRGRLIGNRVL